MKKTFRKYPSNYVRASSRTDIPIPAGWNVVKESTQGWTAISKDLADEGHAECKIFIDGKYRFETYQGGLWGWQIFVYDPNYDNELLWRCYTTTTPYEFAKALKTANNITYDDIESRYQDRYGEGKS